MFFGSRKMTRDIDVVIPQKDKALIAGLVETVAKD